VALKRLVPAVVLAVLLMAMPARAIGRFSPSIFKFVTTVKDDGQGEAGGWQEASADLSFVDTRTFIPRSWSCHLIIGMPLRVAVLGRIAPDSAAEMSADIATDASGVVMHSRPEWLTAEFCQALKVEMQGLFGERHPHLGARVASP
jgi:hypothetical protein